jgi:hypothetical protein
MPHAEDPRSDEAILADIGRFYQGSPPPGPSRRLLDDLRALMGIRARLAAVQELLAWARKVSPVRPVVEAAWVQEALDTGRMPELGEHRKSIV